MSNSNQEMTLSSLSELNRSLRQQAVDLVLCIAAMKESADLPSGLNLQEMNSILMRTGLDLYSAG